MKLLSILLVIGMLSGCAASRGFYAGVTGGPLAVDEAVYDDIGYGVETHLKSLSHKGLLISTSLLMWPLAAAYGSASGAYGAWKFHNVEKGN